MISDFIDYIYPRNIKCILCKNPISKNNSYSLCKDCFNKLNFINNGCLNCGKPLTDFYKNDICSNCETNEYVFTRALSCVEYDDNIHKLIYSLKYGAKTYLAYNIAEIMNDKLEYEGVKFDYIIPVPLHKNRLRKRGYNQSLLICKQLSKINKKEVLDIVIRNKNTQFLSKLTKKERIKKLQNVFTLATNDNKIYKKDLLIVDDIFTTGTTVNEISKKLLNSGANKIYAITFATGKNIY
ncbi:ComF family protein [Tepidibacter hydrothermalis]|uniref:ComF family protein n=1 Tax=Tepidibacter hydrothermalis TaxID=3036126 RepID=A0ABY8EAV0_9FIRM|nr:ComF family protein [Tepidibacter hydrothermalis]WFD10046.1 ComF family protein [Tepidibacter hydrothermalis]